MDNSLFLSFILFFSFFFIPSSSQSPCPIDLSYVETLPWDTSLCQETATEQCCQTLLSLFGIGLAQHLKETSNFQLQDQNSSSSCLSNFQTKLSSMSIHPPFVPLCFKNSNQFVISNLSCAGIVTTQDWVEKVGETSPLESACKGDLTGLTRCSSCLDAGLKVNSQLVGLAPNSTKCFYFTILYAAGIVNEFGPKDARTATCILGLELTEITNGDSSKDSDRKRLRAFVFGFIGASVGILVILGSIVVYKIQVRRTRYNQDNYASTLKARVMPNTGATWFNESELARATDGFSHKNLLGHGGNGIVFKGILPSRNVVAVKHILDLDSEGDEEFLNEVEIISKIRHRNLLPLRGCCVSGDRYSKKRYFIYDFMPNGSLNDHLFDPKKRLLLTWSQRKNIILDVAKGLAYLHYGIKPAIFHRDIKATNILLDSEMNAKVADFGLAKQIKEGKSHLTTRVAGTYGYLAPEYALYGQLTEKSDVYSFGIIVLEIMSGKRVLDTSSSSMLLITDWVWMKVKSKNMEEVFDECLRAEGPRAVMERFVLVGILCAHVMVAFRPTIAEALRMLEGDIDIPKLPARPLPLAHESFRSSSQVSSSTSVRSSNSVLSQTD